MADLGKTEEILVGAASIYISNTPGAGVDVKAKPAYAASSYRTTLEPTGSQADWDAAEDDVALPAAWRNVGFTQEGLEISYEPDYGDVEVDQILDSAVVFKQSMRVSLNTTLAQATLLNLMVAWGQSSSTLTSDASGVELEIAGGELGEAPVERGFIAVGNGPRGFLGGPNSKYSERVYHAYRTLNVEASTHSAKRNENTGIPVAFRALPANNGLYGKIKDRKRTW
jgi:hypothetical protein